jgi:putative Mg2+ transporter-C (MgtC) family protein
MQALFGTDNFDILPHAIALLAAYLLAVPIGWNREKEERSAGLRTFPLVAVASCGFIQAAETIAHGSAEALARINEGVIVGMGFIGGGAILRLKDSVQGTATAASIWVTGAIGVSCGLGAFDIALVLAAMAFATLRLMRPLKKAAGVDDDAESGGGTGS